MSDMDFAAAVRKDLWNRRAIDFCAGYALPENVTLGDVLGVLEEAYKISRRVDWQGDEPYTAADAAQDLHAISGKVYPIFSLFKREEEQ